MTGTLRDRLAAALDSYSATATGYDLADVALQILATESCRAGICGATPQPSWVLNGVDTRPLCRLIADHTGMHEAAISDGVGYWPYSDQAAS